MDIMELGAVGELVGGLAVIASLIYVGIQVRQGNERAQESIAMERSRASREVSQNWGDLVANMTDPEFMALLQRATGGFDNLSHVDKGRIAGWMLSYYLLVLSAFHARQEGVMNENMSHAWIAFFASFVKSPGLNEWWRSMMPYFQTDIVTEVEGLLRDPATRPIHEGQPWYGPEPQGMEA